MFQDLFTSSALLALPIVGMLACMATFVGVVVWVSSRKRRSHYERMSEMPLNDDREDESR